MGAVYKLHRRASSARAFFAHRWSYPSLCLLARRTHTMHMILANKLRNPAAAAMLRGEGRFLLKSALSYMANNKAIFV